ncbi:MAG: hypothetical protein F6K19_43085 [Cyanothece sp. SIO1E1]|nr:hypothetical protein [Cyanothece sp. SIO1E1]
MAQSQSNRYAGILDKNLEQFVASCRKIQPQDQQDARKLFEGIICFPYEQELLLQAFLFLNLHVFFPTCTHLLLFEKPPVKKYTDQGKCDFVFLTEENTLFLIETKFIDTAASGTRAVKKRTRQRQRVIAQVQDLRLKFSKYWGLPLNYLECGVFTTDLRLADYRNTWGVTVRATTLDHLKQWQREQRTRLRL